MRFIAGQAKLRQPPGLFLLGDLQIMRYRASAFLAALLLSGASPAFAQQAPTPEQRLQRLERQIEQMQRRVFPRGRPADTAGFVEEPAATQSSVVTLSERLNSLERQMAEILRLTEENGHRLRSMESDLGRVRTEQDSRIAAVERAIAEAAARPVAPMIDAPSDQPRPTATRPIVTPPASTGEPAVAESDPGEDAYTEGFRQWDAGQYDRAITSLRAFVSAYPRHRRVSWANNLIGRALLDKGEPRAAAEAFLSNYRSNPSGGRAADSLYYLGQASQRLGQPDQACRAYSELEAVYGSNMRDELKSLLPGAKTAAGC